MTESDLNSSVVLFCRNHKVFVLQPPASEAVKSPIALIASFNLQHEIEVRKRAEKEVLLDLNWMSASTKQ